MKCIIKLHSFGLLFLGLIAGFLSAALGIGGGAIMVPALVLFFCYDMKKAIGTSLVTIVPTAFVGIIVHYILDGSNIKWVIVLFVVMGSVIGAKFGSILAKKIHSTILKRIFALLIVFTGLKMVNIIKIPTQVITTISAYPLLVALGLFAGSASALLGIGGGVIMVPVLNLFFGLNIHQAVATSLTIILPTTFAGAIFHRKFDNIEVKSLKFLIPMSLAGAVLGAAFTNSLPSSTIKMIFGLYLFIAAIMMLLKK
jgi:uncharacterized membrane protein YfcA